MITELKIAELLCTRLCHDLTGPIGAVNNGAEFLSEEGFDLQNQAVDLIISSAHEAVSRLQFFRLAYGRVNDHGEACLADKKKTISDFFSGSKIVLDWPDNHTDASGVSISQKMARLLLNMVIIASSTLIKGGTIAVRLSEDADGSKEVRVTATGDAVKWDPDQEAVLKKQVELNKITPKTVQLYISAMLADEISASLPIVCDKNSFTISGVQKKAA